MVLCRLKRARKRRRPWVLGVGFSALGGGGTASVNFNNFFTLPVSLFAVGFRAINDLRSSRALTTNARPSFSHLGFFRREVRILPQRRLSG